MNKKHALHAVICVLVLFILVWLLGRLFSPKYAIGVREGAMTQDYYQEKHDHDVIFLGDCEVYENVSPVAIWKESGVTSYVRGNSQQLIWQSYHLLEETLSMETPKVVVYNVHAMRFSEPQNEAYNRMMLDGMKWSKYKVAAIKDSMLEEESFLSYVFPLFRYHSRWNELSAGDVSGMFSHTPSTVAGYLMRMDIKPLQRLPQAPILTDPEFSDICWDYMEKMRLLCEENGVEFVLIKSSSIWPVWYDEWEEQIVDYAKEHDLTYINMIPMQEELGIDFETDTYDSGLHLNYYGAEKASVYLAHFLQDRYGLEDHRSEADLSADWNEKMATYESIKEQQLEELALYGRLKSWIPEE